MASGGGRGAGAGGQGDRRAGAGERGLGAGSGRRLIGWVWSSRGRSGPARTSDSSGRFGRFLGGWGREAVPTNNNHVPASRKTFFINKLIFHENNPIYIYFKNAFYLQRKGACGVGTGLIFFLLLNEGWSNNAFNNKKSACGVLTDAKKQCKNI